MASRYRPPARVLLTKLRGCCMPSLSGGPRRLRRFNRHDGHRGTTRRYSRLDQGSHSFDGCRAMRRLARQ
jgi:hypothetical protein